MDGRRYERPDRASHRQQQQQQAQGCSRDKMNCENDADDENVTLACRVEAFAFGGAPLASSFPALANGFSALRAYRRGFLELRDRWVRRKEKTRKSNGASWERAVCSTLTCFK